VFNTYSNFWKQRKLINFCSFKQGDQMGRIFACWEIVFFENYKSGPNMGNFFRGKSNASKMGWATFWAIFSHAHPATLTPCKTSRLPTYVHTYIVGGRSREGKNS
jgi:hypothetical protein